MSLSTKTDGVRRLYIDTSAYLCIHLGEQLDLAHLRTALWFHGAEPIARFVTMDTAQEQAAKEFGLPVQAGA